jgi:hypothetical protein
VVARKNEEEVDITIVPPAPPEPEKVGAVSEGDAPAGDPSE